MIFNRVIFFNEVRDSLFRGSLSKSQVDGMERILAMCETKMDPVIISHVAYILATAYHETGRRMVPVREGFCRTNRCSVRAVTKLYNRGRISRNYAKPDSKGRSYYGRGIVQITWKRNYDRVGKKLGYGNQLLENPDFALIPNVSTTILVEGMQQGLFTGKKLSDYLPPGRDGSITSFRKARKIVNGTDKATLIAGYAMQFQNILKKSSSRKTDTLPIEYKEIEEIKEDVTTGKTLPKSTTAWGAVISLITSLLSTITQTSTIVAIVLILVSSAAAFWIIRERYLKSKDYGV